MILFSLEGEVRYVQKNEILLYAGTNHDFAVSSEKEFNNKTLCFTSVNQNTIQEYKINQNNQYRHTTVLCFQFFL